MAGQEIPLGSLFSVLHPTIPRNEHVTMELAPRCPSLCRTKMIYATFTAPKQYGPRLEARVKASKAKHLEKDLCLKHVETNQFTSPIWG